MEGLQPSQWAIAAVMRIGIARPNTAVVLIVAVVEEAEVTLLVVAAAAAAAVVPMIAGQIFPVRCNYKRDTRGLLVLCQTAAVPMGFIGTEAWA